MKKFTALVVFLGLSFSLMAQSNAVKMNLLSAVVRTVNVQYEHVLNEGASFQLGGYFTAASWGASEIQFRGYGITPEYRFYFGDDPAPMGFYVAPFFRYQNWNLQSTADGSNDEADFKSFGGGVIVGRSWIFSEKVIFEIFIGPKYSDGKIEIISGSDSFDLGFLGGGFGLRSGMTVGIVF